MKASHRTALSLLLTIIIFTVIALLAVFGGFRYVEMHYYQPRVVNNITGILDAIGSSYDSYADSLVTAFSNFALDERSRTFFERDVTTTDLESRMQMTGELMEKNPGLEGIRLVESDGVHVHFSTYPGDILTQSDELVAYRDYSELNELPIQFIAVADNGEYAGTLEEMSARVGIYLDSARERIVFSLPYFDKYTAHRGSLIFYVEPNEFVRQIIAENIVSLNTRLKIVAKVDDGDSTQNTGNSGFVFGMPNVGRNVLSESILKAWNAKRYGSEPLVQTEDDDILILVTGTNCKYGKIGWICHDSEFTFSDTEKILLLVCLFVTLFLIIFILFNFRHDDSVIIRERVHKFEMALFREYLEHRDTDDWRALEKNVSMRKQDVNAEIVKSLGLTGKKHSKEISEALDRSWNDFMHLVSGGYRATLENLVSHGPAVTKPESPEPAVAIESSPVEEVEEIEEVEEVEELEDLDGLETLEEVGDDVSPVSEELGDPVEELPEAEPVDDAAEIRRGNMKSGNAASDYIDDDIEELEAITDSGDDLDVPEVEDFVDPLENDDSPYESAVPYDLEEISPEEEAQLAQAASQEKDKFSWQDEFLDDDEIGTPKFDDLDEDDENFWREGLEK